MLKKKFVTLLLAVSLVCCGITGCGGTKDASSQQPDTEQGSGTEPDGAEEKPDAAESTDTAGSEAAQEQETSAQAAETETKKIDLENATAGELVGDIVMGWNLGNSLDCYNGQTNEGLVSETSWQNPVSTKEMIDFMKDKGFNAVRVPVTWYNHMDASGYQIDEEWMNRVEEVVNYVLDNDMYCIINVHHDTGEKGWLKATSANLEEKEKKFTAIWEQICERFGEYDNRLLFEGFNEILDEVPNWYQTSEEAISVTNELNQLFVDTVRATGGKNAERCLIVNTYCAGANNELTRGFILPTDTVSDKLIVEVHIYQPYLFTEGKSDTWAEGKGELSRYIKNVSSTFVEKGVPVIVGEFGCVNSTPKLERLTWLQYFMETARDSGLKCFWWDNGAEYRIFDRNGMKITEPEMLDAMMTEARGETYVVDAEKLSQETETTKKTEDPSNLCSNPDNWSFWVNEDSTASAKMNYTENGIQVEVTSPGSNTWDIQLSYVNLNLEKGAHYRLSFDYFGEPKQTMNFSVMQNYPEYASYSTLPLDYKAEPQHYKAEYVMSEPTDPNSRITFDCGASKVGGTYTVTIENVVLTKVE